MSNQYPISMHLGPTREQVLTKARERIQELHKDIVAHLETALHKAIRLGGELVAVQPFLKHGRRYEEWIDANLPFSARTARDYVTLWRHRELIQHEANEDRHSIRAALKLISDSAKAVSPVDALLCPEELDVDEEQVPEEEDPVKLADREILIIEAEPGFVKQIVNFVRLAQQSGRKITFSRKSVLDD